MPLGKVKDPATGRHKGWKVNVAMLDTPLGNDLLKIATRAWYRLLDRIRGSELPPG
jgi:hypothetical protein